MKFNYDIVPSTINDAINLLFDSLDKEDKEDIKNSKACETHFGLGMYLRNNWSMWETDTPLVQDFIKRFNLFGHADDVSALILEGVWARVHGDDENVALQNRAKEFREHWISCNIDPVTGKRRA